MGFIKGRDLPTPASPDDKPASPTTRESGNLQPAGSLEVLNSLDYGATAAQGSN